MRRVFRTSYSIAVSGEKRQCYTTIYAVTARRGTVHLGLMQEKSGMPAKRWDILAIWLAKKLALGYYGKKLINGDQAGVKWEEVQSDGQYAYPLGTSRDIIFSISGLFSFSPVRSLCYTRSTYIKKGKGWGAFECIVSKV